MEYKILGKQNDIALIITDEVVIKDTQSALDMIASAQYETDCDKLMTLGEKIAKLRTEHHLSQGDLAEKIGISRQSISKWETGSSVPDR